MERCGASPPFTLKSLNTAAGDNPFLCTDLVLIQSNSRVESCVNTNIWRSRISNRGEERIWRERIKRRGKKCFSENLRHCPERVCQLRSLEEPWRSRIFLEQTQTYMGGKKWPHCCSDVEGVSRCRSGGRLKKKVPFNGLSASKRHSPYTRERCVTRWCCQRNQTPSPLR